VSSSATNLIDLPTTGKTQETNQAETEVMEPSSSNEMGRGEASSSLPEFMDDEVTGLQRENLTDNQIFAENPEPTKPPNSRVLKESVKLVGRTINWAGDPLKAFEDLIPVALTDTVGLSRREIMDKMSYHLVDVSLSDFTFPFFDYSLDSANEFYLNSFVFIGLSKGYDFLPWILKGS
jgi:hypothetical protein